MKRKNMAQYPENKNSSLVNFALMARFHGHLDVEDLRDALKRLKGRQRVFDLRSPRDLYDPDAPETGPYHLDVLPDCTPEDWKAVAARELARPLDLSGPRVRFVLITHPQADDLLIVCDHGGSDGISGTLLLQDLLELLNNPSLPSLPVPPPVWKILPKSVTRSFSGRVHSLIIKIALSFFRWKQNRQKSGDFEPTFQVASAEISAELTKTLLERCRSEDTSVHGAVCAAWLLALDPQKTKDPSRRSVSSPVSLRKYLSPEMRSCAGMYYTAAVTGVEDNPAQGFWDIAREIKQEMIRAEKNQVFYTLPLALEVMSRSMSRLPEGEVYQMPQMPVSYDYSITNLGRVRGEYIFSGSQSGRYYIDALYGPMVNAFRGEKTVGVCTTGGKLRFVFTTSADEMDLGTTNDWMERAVKFLEDAL